MATKEIEEENEYALKEVIKNFGEGIPQLKLRFLSEIGQHEVLDRTYIVNENFQEYILNHPYIVLQPKLFAKAFNLLEELFDLYQEIGKEDYAKN